MQNTNTYNAILTVTAAASTFSWSLQLVSGEMLQSGSETIHGKSDIVVVLSGLIQALNNASEQNVGRLLIRCSSRAAVDLILTGQTMALDMSEITTQAWQQIQAIRQSLAQGNHLISRLLNAELPVDQAANRRGIIEYGLMMYGGT